MPEREVWRLFFSIAGCWQGTLSLIGAVYIILLCILILLVCYFGYFFPYISFLSEQWGSQLNYLSTTLFLFILMEDYLDEGDIIFMSCPLLQVYGSYREDAILNQLLEVCLLSLIRHVFLSSFFWGFSHGCFLFLFFPGVIEPVGWRTCPFSFLSSWQGVSLWTGWIKEDMHYLLLAHVHMYPRNWLLCLLATKNIWSRMVQLLATWIMENLLRVIGKRRFSFLAAPSFSFGCLSLLIVKHTKVI